MKGLSLISEQIKDIDKLDIRFHTHIPYLLECARTSEVTKAFKNYALQTLANLAQRAYLRPYILYNEGLRVFVDALRDYDNLVGRRIAGRAIVNATKSDATNQ